MWSRAITIWFTVISGDSMIRSAMSIKNHLSWVFVACSIILLSQPCKNQDWLDLQFNALNVANSNITLKSTDIVIHCNWSNLNAKMELESNIETVIVNWNLQVKCDNQSFSWERSDRIVTFFMVLTLIFYQLWKINLNNPSNKYDWKLSERFLWYWSHLDIPCGRLIKI